MASLRYSHYCHQLILEESNADRKLLNSPFGPRTIILHPPFNAKMLEHDYMQKVAGFFNTTINFDDYWHSQDIALMINPWLIYINYQLFVYFGKDMPKVFTKTAKRSTAIYKFWTADNKFFYKDITVEYKYARVKEPEKLFKFGNTYRFKWYEIVKRYSQNDYLCRMDISPANSMKLYFNNLLYKYHQETIS